MTSRESWLGGFALVALLLVPFGPQGMSGNPRTKSFYDIVKETTGIPILPPAWLFGPIWAILYVLMAVAIVLWSESADTSAWTWLAIWITFVVNVFVNKVWTPMFFSAQIIPAAVDAVLILLTAVAVLVFLWLDETSVQRTWATILWSFYVLWALFASILSIWIAVKNSTVQAALKTQKQSNVLLYRKGDVEVSMNGDISIQKRQRR
jgi:translocator protein